jgi:transposase
MRRYALRDDQWDRIKDFLPGREGHVGGTAADNRLFVEAVLYRYRAGIPWRDLPERFGDWKIVHQRFSRWAKSGVFERIFKLLASDHDNEYMMIDATIVRAHQHSAGARKKRRTSDRPIPWRTDDQNPCPRRCLGQSGQIDAYAGTGPRSGLCRAIDRRCRSRCPAWRQGLRRRSFGGHAHATRHYPGDSPKSQSQISAALRLRAVLRTQPRRALLQQTQAFSRHRHPIRQARKKFPCRSSARIRYNPAQLKTGSRNVPH